VRGLLKFIAIVLSMPELGASPDSGPCAAERRCIARANGLALSGHRYAINPHPGRAERQPILEGGARSDLDNITVTIADLAAPLAAPGDRLGDERGSSTFP
jgi:hypothetical protein